MPWKVTQMTEAREAFVKEALSAKRPVTELCAAYGISRKTGYKWLARYASDGAGGLADRSRAAIVHPHAVSADVRTMLLATKHRFPAWGPRKVLAVVEREHPALVVPSATTVHELFKREGLVRPRRQRRRSPHYTSPVAGYYGPNALWCADYKGTMKSAAGPLDPLTITDGFSRYLFAVACLRKNDGRHTKPVFEALFREFGLPDSIRTDNGPPFATVGLAGLSSLSIWFVKLGIVPDRSRPGCPQDNGRHERLHRTMEAECSAAVAASKTPQTTLEQFRQTYNTVRPHESLNNKVPEQVYVASPKRYPKRLADPVYPDDLFVERLSNQGCLSFMGQSYYLAAVLAGQLVGIRMDDDNQAQIRFGPIHLGCISPISKTAVRPNQTRRFIPAT